MFGQFAEFGAVVDGVVVDGVVADGVVVVVVLDEELPVAAFAIAAPPPAIAAVASKLAAIVCARLCM
jgi:hypothetical protein